MGIKFWPQGGIFKIGAQSGGGVSVSSGGPWYRAGGSPAPVAAYQPIRAASLAASYINLINPGTNNAAPGTAPTFAAATGWTFNGTDQYLTTGLVPATGWSMFVRFSGAAGTTTEFVAGSRSTASASLRFLLYPRLTTDNHGYGHGGAVDVAGRLASGVMAICGASAYLNGVSDATVSTGWSGTTVREIFIGALNLDGSANGFFGGDVQAVAIYNSTLTPTQAAAVSAAMAAL